MRSMHLGVMGILQLAKQSSWTPQVLYSSFFGQSVIGTFCNGILIGPSLTSFDGGKITGPGPSGKNGTCGVGKITGPGPSRIGCEGMTGPGSKIGNGSLTGPDSD